MANRYESFLDTEYIESNTAGAASVLSPTKSGSNPVLEGQDGTHYEEFRYISVVKFAEDDYKMWATVLHWDGAAYSFMGVARFDSDDGVTWTAPNLGLVTFDGNTNNNLVLGSASGYVGQSMIYDPNAPAGQEYRLLLEVEDGTSGAWIYSAADADSQPTELVNPEPDLDDNATNNELEAKAMIVRADGRLAIYSVHRQSPEDDRSGLLGISETTDFSGDYYDHGEVSAWDSGGPTDQYYTMRVQALADDAWVAFVTRYNSTSELGPVDLFFSRDQGMTWTSVDAGWLPLGSGGSWDDSFIYPDQLIRVGNDWRLYYTGMDTVHDTLPKGADVGFASLGYGRLAEITGSGVVTSTEVWVGTGGTLTVNADGSGGDVDVAILDASDDSTIGGFGGTISADSFGTEFSLPTNQLIKVEITLASGASLYGYEVESSQTEITRSSIGLLAEDDFDRGNNTVLRNNWSKFGTPDIVGSELELDVVQGSEVSVWQNPANVSAGEMLVQARMVQETSSARPLMMLRWWDGRLISGSDPNGFRLIIEGDRIRMDTLVNGSPTTIGQATSFGAAGSDVHLQAYVADGVQEVWGDHAVNGEKSFSGSSTSHDAENDRTAGMAGLSTNATQPMVGDDFIMCSGKTVTCSGLDTGQKFKVYAVDGTLIGSATESGGTATVSVSKFDSAGAIIDVGGWQYATVTDASDNELARFERTPAIKGIYPGGVYSYARAATPPSKPTVFIDQVHDDSVDASTSVFIPGEGGSHTHSRWRIRDAVTQAIVYNPGDDASNLTSIDLAGSGIPLDSDKNYEISVEHKEDDSTYSPPADWVPFKTSGGGGGGGVPIERSFRVIVYEQGEDIGGAIEFGLEERHLVTPLEVGGQVARVLDGYAESLPYVVRFHDPDEDVAPLLFDANGRPAVLGRVVEVRLIEDETEVTVDVRRLATVRMQEAPVIELELIDEAAFDRVLLFERNDTIQVVGPGPVSEWADVAAAVGVDAEVVDSSGDFRQIDADSGIIIVRGPQKTALEQDVIDSPSGSNTSGNFKALTARLGGVARPITSFGALAADTADDILDLDEWGDAGLSMPPFWVYWPGGPGSGDAGTLDMDFTGLGGVPTTAELPYLIEEDDIRDLLTNAMGGGAIYGVQGSVSPMRFLLPSTTELPVDRIPQPVHLAVPGPVSRIDFVRQVARIAGLVLWMDNQGRIVPRPWEVPPIADFSQGELDALFLFDASTATSAPTYEVMLSRAFNVWRAQGTGLFPRTVGVEDTPFIGLQIDAAEVEFDDAASSPIGPGRTVFDADFPGYLVGDGLVDASDSVGQLFVGQTVGGQAEGRLTGHAVSDAPMPGDLVLLDHDSLKGLNPATGTRAGLQLARVVDRRRAYTDSEVFFEYRIIYGGAA